MQWQIVWVRKNNNNNYEVSEFQFVGILKMLSVMTLFTKKKIYKFLNFWGEVQKKKKYYAKKKSFSINISYLKFKRRYIFFISIVNSNCQILGQVTRKCK